MTLKELFSGVAFSVKDKAGSRLGGSIIVAWIVWNWEALYTTIFLTAPIKILSEETVKEFPNKLEYIRETYAEPENLWNPIGIGILLTVIFPVLSTLTNIIPDYLEVARNNLTNKIFKRRTYTRDEFLKVVRERDSERENYAEANREYENMKKENQQLKEIKEKGEETIKTKDSEIEKLNGKINELKNRIKEITEEGEKFIFDSEKAPTPEPPRYDDHEMPDKLNIKDHNYSIEIKPLINETGHWRCGIQFSQKIDNFLDRKKRHGQNFPLLHLTKNEDEPELKVTYYDNNGKHVSDNVLIKKYSGESVVIKLTSKNQDTILDILEHKTGKSLLRTKYEISGLYGKLFVWGDYTANTKDNSPNKYRIEAKIKTEDKR